MGPRGFEPRSRSPKPRILTRLYYGPILKNSYNWFINYFFSSPGAGAASAAPSSGLDSPSVAPSAGASPSAPASAPSAVASSAALAFSASASAAAAASYLAFLS